MPELPEVQTTVNDLKQHLLAQKICGVEVFWHKTIAAPTISDFQNQITGMNVNDITRRGKFIVIHLQGLKKHRKYLLVHLRMTGNFRFEDQSFTAQKHDRVVFSLDNHLKLVFKDPRKFARMWLVDEVNTVVKNLGPEPLTISLQEFEERLEKRQGRIKTLLLDQTFLAGIGNIYTDESLWQAQIHPLTVIKDLNKKQIVALHQAIQFVLQKAIDLDGTSFDQHYKRVNGQSGRYQNEFSAYGRKGKACFRCSTAIVKTVVGQRGTYICMVCQKI